MKLFLGNLNYDAVEGDIAHMFNQHSIVATDIKIPIDRESGKARGFGFCHVSDLDASAALAMNGTELMGRAISIREADERPRPGRAMHVGHGGRRGRR